MDERETLHYFGKRRHRKKSSQTRWQHKINDGDGQAFSYVAISSPIHTLLAQIWSLGRE